MPFSLIQPLHSIPIACLDLETTGASAQFGHRAIEIGIVRYENGAKVAEYSQLLDPCRPISRGVTALTGISQAMCQGQPTFVQQMPAMMRLLDGAAILGHNIRFDLSFLRKEFRAVHTDIVQALKQAPVFDTVRIARRRFGRGGNGLGNLSRRLGHEPAVAHRALADAETTAIVFDRLLHPLGGWQIALCDVMRHQGGPMGLLPVSSRESLLPLELEEALEQRRPVMMEYLDAGDNRTHRVVEPIQIRRFNGELILIAHCQLRNDRRTFKLDRVVRLSRLDLTPPIEIATAMETPDALVLFPIAAAPSVGDSIVLLDAPPAIRNNPPLHQMITSQQIRAQFIDFFVRKHAHTFVPSSPVVPIDDPTLLFTNAGMNQFKPIFLGQEKRAYTRAVNTQKCIRAGGKHNDLDDVGRSRRHHTLFEMLGNWSFGDYFKQGAIEMAWELLTGVWKLDPSRLHVTCYEGNPAAGIPRDDEAAAIWKSVAGFPDDHIHYFGKDNFWEMGDTGPCGPCTEIYIDRTPDKTGGKDVNGEDPRVMEIWNLVFIQFNRDAAGVLTPLPARHVDTGMGFERVCQVLQGKDDNYGTDLWTPLFDAIHELSGITYTGLFPKTNSPDPAAEAASEQLRHDIAFRVVADHVRCLTFALTDGATPSNEGRGYVLRRILRRAVRFGRQQLHLNEPFLHTLVPVVVDSMGSAFPELLTNPGRVIDLIKDEEISFSRTLDRGIQLFDEAARTGKISGPDAFKLHDTYGFPIDLTRIMAEERGMTVDIAVYEKLMEEARELARSGGKEDKPASMDLTPAALGKLAGAGIAPTDDRAKFLHDPIQATVLAIWNGIDLVLPPGEAVESAPLAVILDRTNFYAEMGGQVGDRGELKFRDGVMDVAHTKTVGGYILHIGQIRNGSIRAGESVTATVTGGRDRTEKNHTATHLANWALREVLGDGVQQKGSLVDPEKLRFDFSHNKAMGDEEIARVETLVNESIRKSLPVYAQEAPQELALKINGLRAVFGEKYPPRVRVVSVGVPVEELLADPGNPRWRQFSVEFCGGTHLGNSSGATAFVITGEESVSKGIRRLVGLTGDAAQTAGDAAKEIETLVAASSAASDEELHDLLGDLQKAVGAVYLPLRSKRRAQAAIAQIQARLKAREKSAKTLAGGAADISSISRELLAAAVPLGPGRLVVGQIASASDEQLRSAMDSLKKTAGSYAILLAAGDEARVTFVAAVSDDLIAMGLKAGDWVKEAAKITGGGGGGRPQMAQGSGKDASKIPESLDKAKQFALATVR